MKTRISSNVRITDRDWEALSAYLDSELDTKEREKIESRLERNPELRAALSDLQKIRTLFKSHVNAPIPRHFTLSPEMAGIPQRTHQLPTVFPALRLASVVATILFVLISLSEKISFGIPAGQLTQPLTQEMMPIEEVAEPPYEPPMAKEGVGEIREVQATEAPVLMEAPVAVAPEQSTQLALGNVVEATAQSNEDITQVMGTPTIRVVSSVSPTISVAEIELADSQVISTMTESIEEGIIPYPISGPSPEVGSIWSLIDSLKVICLFIAIASGLAAIYIYRSNSK